MTEAEWYACDQPLQRMTALPIRLSTDRCKRLAMTWYDTLTSRLWKHVSRIIEVPLRHALDSLIWSQHEGHLVLGYLGEAVRMIDGNTSESTLMARWWAEVDDLIGNPYRPFAVAPVWRSENVLALARTIQTTEDFHLMPLLADALQEAGCTETALLDHCMKTKCHVSGCCALAALLEE
jgi:hypothetical protein